MLPHDQGRGPASTFPKDVTAAVHDCARATDVTPFMTVLAAFALVLGHQGGQSRLLIGTDTAQRTETALEPLIGFFVNQLALRVDFGGAATFRSLLEAVRAQTHALPQINVRLPCAVGSPLRFVQPSPPP